jgi:hypothetical protein
VLLYETNRDTHLVFFLKNVLVEFSPPPHNPSLNNKMVALSVPAGTQPIQKERGITDCL